MFKVVLPIYCHTKETFNQEELGLEIDYSSMRIELITFYHIDFVELSVDEDCSLNGRTGIISSGKYMESPLSIDEVNELIEDGFNTKK